MKKMHLIGMKVSNFLKVTSFNYQFDGKSVKLSGKNGAGKTSVLQAIWAACHGKKAVPKDPRHKGEKKGEIVLDLGELTIKRTFTEKGTYLTVTTKDGMKPRNPQVLLDKLVGTIALDPHAFMELAPKIQMERAAAIAGVADDIVKVDNLLKTVEDDRRFANRWARDLSGTLNSMTVPSGDGTVQDTSKLEKQIDAARVLGEDITGANNTLKYTEASIDDLAQRIDIAEQEQKILKDKIATAKTKQLAEAKALTAAKKKAAKLRPIDEMSAELTTARDNNELVRQEEVARELYEQKSAEYAKATKDADALDERVKKGRAKRAEIIKKANLPVDGIDFTDDGLVFNGHPFEQASHAEQLKVSIGILMSQNPDLKLLTIKDASLMDSDSWKVVEKLRKQYDFQVIYEVVSDKVGSKDSGLFITDGTVSHIDGKKVEAADVEADAADADAPDPDLMF